ncbi:MAG TPA: hypothetical protein PLG07_14545 [Phenylobacterium sp.]|nr:hypothetical protein [Phenylobacterium sp.]
MPLLPLILLAALAGGLLSVILALGAGLFGPSLAALTGAAPGRPRELVMELLRSRIMALGGGL